MEEELKITVIDEKARQDGLVIRPRSYNRNNESCFN